MLTDNVERNGASAGGSRQVLYVKCSAACSFLRGRSNPSRHSGFSRTLSVALDTLSPEWDPVRALRAARSHPDAEIADVLLDQGIFAGVGNIIKNEVLFRTGTHPHTVVRDIPTRQLKAIVADARVFSERFLELRRGFALRKNLEIYGRSLCSRCGGRKLSPSRPS